MVRHGKKGGNKMVKQVVLTKEGLEKLENELEELKGVKRKDVAEKIKVALSFGDLSENSEYDEAKNEQAIVEARIADIEVMLKNVRVIDESELSGEDVHIGSKIELRMTNPKTGASNVVNYKIVGSNEADPLNGCISDESAVGKALLSHGIGDKVEVEVPMGIMEYEILTISK
jgi:transcription elongation factor GreA